MSGSIVLGWPALIGQAGPVVNETGPGGMPAALVVICLAGIVVVIGLPVWLGIKAEVRKRELEHAERMRAIELGRPIPGEGGWWTPARTAAAIGVGVPLGVFVLALAAAERIGSAAPFIWPSAGAVGLAAVICGTVLAARLPHPRPIAPDHRAKPYVDPDAYDMAEHHHS